MSKKKLIADQIHEIISLEAYYIWEMRIKKRKKGDALQDWIIAEREVREKYVFLFLSLDQKEVHTLDISGLESGCPVCGHVILEAELGRAECEACGGRLFLKFGGSE